MEAITGNVVDSITGMPVFNAHVIFTDANGNPYSPISGTVTDPDGKFKFDITRGTHLKVTHIEYKSQIKPIGIYASGTGETQIINFSLQPAAVNLPEVVIRPAKNWFEKHKLLSYLSLALLIGVIVIKKPDDDIEH